MDLFLTATSLVSDANTWFDFLGTTFSAVSELLSGWRHKQERRHGEAERRQLQWKEEDMKMKQLHYCLLDLPDLINHAEWFSYIKDDKEVAKLLPELRLGPSTAAAAEQPGDDFLKTITDGNHVREILDDLNCLRNTLEGIIDRRTRAEPQQFGKLLRPVMSSFYDKSKVRRLQKEVDEVLELLEVDTCSLPRGTRKRRISEKSAALSKRARRTGAVPSTSASEEGTTANATVLAISGIGGVGKTTLARQVFNDERTKGHFDLKIWISVSDDFNVKRLTKEFIHSALENLMQSDNLCSLQQTLTERIISLKFLLVLDDVWDDVYSNQDNRWHNFLEPLKSAKQGNRSIVNPELNPIGKKIIPQLKRCPLAAETLGRILKPMLDREHWDWVAGRELWELKQEKYDILPVLRLSYLYLPPHLRSCFLFCSMYPKGHRFVKDALVNSWIAAGLIESCKGGKLESDGHRYFAEFLHRSLLHRDASSPASSVYVIHELMHDMAKLVSENECFVVKGEADLQKIPEDVRHLSIIGGGGLDETNLKMLCQYKKLRSIVCHGVDSEIITPAAKHWFEVLTKIRMLGFLSCKLDYLPETIGNLKLLQYLSIGECTIEFTFEMLQLRNSGKLSIKFASV
nr:putative disease resistance protein RGA3 [Aegilops tauschii subsp. strangulata]